MPVPHSFSVASPADDLIIRAIEPGIWLTLVAEDLNGTAVLLEYGNLRVLIPNGVDYADI